VGDGLNVVNCTKQNYKEKLYQLSRWIYPFIVLHPVLIPPLRILKAHPLYFKIPYWTRGSEQPFEVTNHCPWIKGCFHNVPRPSCYRHREYQLKYNDNMLRSITSALSYINEVARMTGFYYRNLSSGSLHARDASLHTK